MTSDERTSVRLDAETLKRLDALIERLMEDPAMRARGQMKRSAVVRLALECGLPILEKKYPPSKKWLD
jgi:predicted DNA-binding protein